MCHTPSFSRARAFIGSSGQWILMLVRYSTSITLAAFCHRRGGVAVLDEEEAFRAFLLQTARLLDDRLVGHVGVLAFVPIDLERRRSLLRPFVAVRYCDHPARSRGGLVLDHDGLDEARNLLGLAIVDRFHRRAIAHRRQRELAVQHARREARRFRIWRSRSSSPECRVAVTTGRSLCIGPVSSA